jgi:hypothetical protein
LLVGSDREAKRYLLAVGGLFIQVRAAWVPP